MILKGQIVDLFQRKIFPGAVTIDNGKITKIDELPKAPMVYLMPGFVDAHVHIESSMLVPASFARMAVRHGTVATVSDPHEIANVLGMSGVHYMIENGESTPFKFYFGAPSCVPATSFETAGAELNAGDVRTLLEDERIVYLSEMMNWPGVLNGDPEVLAKIRAARELGKPVDGHAPGLSPEQAVQYIAAGISTDHESTEYEEARNKLIHGMKILIREGSAARNFEALHPLISEFPGMIMFCSDDKHPDSLMEGHINQLVARAVAKGHDLFDVLQAACINPVEHYGLDVGLLREGDPADLAVVNDLNSFQVSRTIIGGTDVFSNGTSQIPHRDWPVINRFNAVPVHQEQFRVPAESNRIRVIGAVDDQLITTMEEAELDAVNGLLVSDPGQDILKLTVINRYGAADPALAFIRGFGFSEGAIASSVGHDSHNVLGVGVSDEALAEAINLVIASRGGISIVGRGRQEVLPLPVAGLMSTEQGEDVAAAYSRMDAFARELGSKLRAPFMTLSFMALLVIPRLKLSDLGLFDGQEFRFTGLFPDSD